MNIEVTMKYPLSQNDRIVVFEIRLHSERLMLYRPALHGNWNALSLAQRQIPHANSSTHNCVAKSSVFLPDPVHRLSVYYRNSAALEAQKVVLYANDNSVLQ